MYVSGVRHEPVVLNGTAAGNEASQATLFGSRPLAVRGTGVRWWLFICVGCACNGKARDTIHLGALAVAYRTTVGGL